MVFGGYLDIRTADGNFGKNDSFNTYFRFHQGYPGQLMVIFENYHYKVSGGYLDIRTADGIFGETIIYAYFRLNQGYLGQLVILEK